MIHVHIIIIIIGAFLFTGIGYFLGTDTEIEEAEIEILKEENNELKKELEEYKKRD